MQIIESTAWGVRSARITLQHPQTRQTVVLFPMVHIGEAQFYTSVYADAFSHDVVLVEGQNSPIASQITKSYRWIKESKKIGLTIQPKYPEPDSCRANIIKSDLPVEDFERLWRQMPIWLRVMVHIVAPVIGLERRYFGSRESLAKGLSLEDAYGWEELLNFSAETGFLDHVILEARDDCLLEHLHHQIDEPLSPPRSVAIVYGAEHMRAVLRDLIHQSGYICTQADWMMVFELEA